MNPLCHLNKSLHPATQPSVHQEPFHANLLKNERRLTARRHRRRILQIVVSRDCSAHGDSAKVFHVRANSCTERSSNLFKGSNKKYNWYKKLSLHCRSNSQRLEVPLHLEQHPNRPFYSCKPYQSRLPPRAISLCHRFQQIQ